MSRPPKFVLRRGVLSRDGTAWVFTDSLGPRHVGVTVQVHHGYLNKWMGRERLWAINNVNGQTGELRPNRRGPVTIRTQEQRNKRGPKGSVRAVSAGLPTLGKR